VSVVPPEIAGIGSSAMKLRVSPGFDPLKAQIGPEEYFLLSRFDGAQTLREVILSTGLPVDRAIAAVAKLRSLGALLLPGETKAPVVAAPPVKVAEVDPPTQPRSQPIKRPPPPPPSDDGSGLDAPTVIRAPRTDLGVVLPNASDEERAALAEMCELGPDERVRVLALMRLVDGKDPWALLGVPHGAEAKVLKRTYFKLSKEIHPDRFYGKDLGSFADRLTTIFEAVSRAYARLTSPEKSGLKKPNQAAASNAEQPQTPQEYAVELFDRACGLEVGGDALGAMKLFAAAVRIDPHTRYLRRAASCALAANQPKSALEYAKKAQTQAPNDPSCARLLAQAFKATGKYADAEEVLVMAMAIKSENDVLTAELRNDLAEVRRLMST
jgi:hypothetical protein